MKKIFKKITASAMAVTALAVNMIGMGASAYGGSGSFTVNGTSVSRSIDGTRTVVYATTSCNSQNCSNVYVSVTGTYASTGSKSDSFSMTRGTAEVTVKAENNKIFSKGNSYHQATINKVTGGDSMSVYIG